MAAYTGSGNFPYWMTITNSGGISGAGAVSENIPVQPGVNYQFQVVASFASTWPSGATVSLTFYNSGGVQLSSNSTNSGSMTGGVLYQLNTGLVTAPAGASFATAQIVLAGNATSALSVYQAEIDDQAYNQVNINFAFTWTFWPWSALSSGTTLAWNSSPLLSGDSDSLVLDGIIELMGGLQGVQSDVPELLDSNGQGPTYRILAPPSMNSAAFGYESSYDLNAPQPTQDVVASMLLDGERPFGARSSNRTITLPVIIFGTFAGGMSQVLKAREYLMSVIDQQIWQMKWTPADTGLPLIFDCFRALPSTPMYGFNYSAGGSATGATIGRPNYPIAMLTLSVQALPYGRSDIDGVQTLAFNSPIVNGQQTVAPVVIDNFTTVFNPPPIINSPAWQTLGTANPTSTTTWNIANAHAVAAGNTVLVQVLSAGNSITGVADTQGNVYTQVAAFSTGGSCWQSVWQAPVSTPLSTSDHVTVTSGSSGSFCSSWYSVTGAWQPRAIVNESASATSTYSPALAGLNNYDMLVSFNFGLGSSGGAPTPFTAVAANSGNGFNDEVSYYCVPINQTTASPAYTGLPNPHGVLLLSFLPLNQYWSQDTIKGLSGDAVHYTAPEPRHSPWPAAVYSQILPAALNITGNTVLSVWFGQSYDTAWPKDPKFSNPITLRWTLTDNLGRTLNFSTAYKKVTYGTNPTVPKWTLLNAAIPQGRAFNYNAVASYAVRITNWSASGHTGYVRMHCWLNQVTANPQTIENAISPRGSVINLFSLPGTARSPVSVQCQLPAVSNVIKEITAPSTGNWIVPPGVYSVQAEAWGGGGAGAAVGLSRAVCGGGGGGAEYAQEAVLPVLPGQKVPWSIGAAGTPGQLQNTVVQYTKNGLGHWTCPANVLTVLAEVWGGGAAGGAGAGGGGGAEYGKVHIPVTPGTTYSLWAGAGGKADTGTSASQVAARQGAVSWFGPPSATSGSNAYIQAHGGSTSLTGASSGGPGGTSGTVAPASQLALIGFSNPSAAKTFTFSPNFGAKLLPLGNAGLLVISVPSAATITVADSSQYGGAPSKWVQVGTASASGCVTYAFLNSNASQLAANAVITVTQSVSQLATIGLYNMPWVVGQDSVPTAGSGTSNAPSILSSTPNNAGDLVIAIFSNSGANTNSNPAGWSTTPNLGTSLFTNLYAIQNSGTSPETATAGYAGSQTWNSLSFTFNAETHFAGGRGGTSPGPSGGGGGGAAGATGAGGAGGDSQSSQAGFGRWAVGGTGGTGTGLGGNGGAGANTPGFPGAGAAPGGGGGGGFQSSPLFSPQNPSSVIPGSGQNNYLGGDGGVGMVQLTYAVGGGVPVNGGNTTFGSAATTGTIVTAHGGGSAANNSAAGGAAGTGSSNTLHNNGGAGGLLTTGPQGSYMATARSTVLQSLGTLTFSSTSGTSSASAGSCAQGVAIAIIASTAKVADLLVTDSAGNVYQELGVQQAGAGGTGVALYTYVANIEFAITTSTTLTITSATSQQYGAIWYASPYLTSGVTTGNSGSGNGTGTAASGQFGITDTAAIQLELGIVLNDNNKTITLPGNQGKVWYVAGSTSTLTAGTMAIAAYVSENQGGGTGAAGTGDVFSATLNASANWATLCVPLTMTNQSAGMMLMDWRSGTTPGAQTTWASELAISANGMIVVLGQCGSGATITSGPSAMADASGNTYTFKNTTVLPTNGGTIFAATAPVTNALLAGTTGTVNWGHASAAPEYWMATYWVPNAVTAIDTAGVTSVTGTGAGGTMTFTPADPNDMVISLFANQGSGSFNVTGAGNNLMDAYIQSYLLSQIYALQQVDETATVFTSSVSPTTPWAALAFGVQMQLAGTGGGAAGGAGTAGYPGVWQLGGPGFAGGGTGKGGAGSGTLNQAGGGAALPGGGGGGAYGNTTAGTEGGQGAPGALRLTWTPPLQALNTLIVHALSIGSDPNVNPIVPIPITDIPNNTEYPVPSVNGLLNATFSSTYTVLLANFSWNAATVSLPRQITMTINQYEYPGGPRYSMQVSRAVTPALDVVNGLLNMGEVTLPLKDYVAYNDQSYFTISINDTDTADRFMDALFLDTLGSTVLINIDPGQAGFGQYVNYFIDEATPDRDLGFVGASFQDRQHQVSVLDYAQINGGALYIGPGDNLFMVYSTSGAPNLAVTYAPRWYLDRSV